MNTGCKLSKSLSTFFSLIEEPVRRLINDGKDFVVITEIAQLVELYPDTVKVSGSIPDFNKT